MRFFSPTAALFSPRRHLILPAPEPGRPIAAELLQPRQTMHRAASLQVIL